MNNETWEWRENNADGLSNIARKLLKLLLAITLAKVTCVGHLNWSSSCTATTFGQIEVWKFLLFESLYFILKLLDSALKFYITDRCFNILLCNFLKHFGIYLFLNDRNPLPEKNNILIPFLYSMQKSARNLLQVKQEHVTKFANSFSVHLFPKHGNSLWFISYQMPVRISFFFFFIRVALHFYKIERHIHCLCMLL